MKATTVTALLLFAALAAGPAAAFQLAAFPEGVRIGGINGLTPGLVAVGNPRECADESNINGDMECSGYECLPGDALWVGVSSDSASWGNAACGEGSVECNGSPGCSQQGKDRATMAGAGDCRGNGGSGWGSDIKCVAGSIEAIQNLLSRSSSSPMTASNCEALAPMFTESGITSIVSATFGQAQDALFWSTFTGCA